MLDQIFGDFPYMLIYVDDLLVFSKNTEVHRHDLEKVLQLMNDNGLVARLDKCVFCVDKCGVLGPSYQC